MTARSAATASKFVLACATASALAIAGCTGFYEIPIETPIQPKMDVTGFQRVLVAGFVSGGTDDVDANLETVRLLRSQLRTKSPLRVIEAEVLPLAEIAANESNAAREGAPAANGSSGPNGLPAVAAVPGADVVKTPDTPKPASGKPVDLGIKNETDLAKFDKIFADVAYWKKLGEE